jgi:sugar/nucleoside kinase (ribokinase family)
MFHFGRRPRKYDVICIGDTVMDAFITLEEASVHCDLNHERCQLCMSFADKIPYKALTVVPAVGNSSNVAVGAARLGLTTGIITAVGGDGYGKEILDHYRKENVASEFVRVNHKKPTNYHFVLNYQAERTILIKHEDYEYFDPRKLDGKTDWIYFSSIGEHAIAMHDKVVTYLKKHPDVKMGFNPGTFQLRFGVKRLRNIYKHTHVLFLNREEGEKVVGKKEGTPLPVLMDALHKLGPKIVVITDGPKGAYASDGTSRYFMPPYPDPKPPVSRTGAGDAFSTGFLCALIYGLPIHDALRWAPIESMHVVQFFGAQTGLLSKSKIQQFLKKAPKNYQPKPI